ncbi:MAG TPA: DUF3467 domain-containing protein [Vicinamibacterales bacterium]|nr:DUF3467 domain-containing protein [Vicinamibacterales bacterium]HOG29977.1 DUF3467 domain-containing protein [Vicinamibacterales bacterium]HOQ61095.1 DUF3467 domain-containing protein [Vicinamibacterales bacterium]HPK73025.1 DUF3467 domain-containing protein [Vicinamibacterales bacterium]HPW21695.1 DUF3467 domain-containing protein [Vicinamibacterales bacterium]
MAEQPRQVNFTIVPADAPDTPRTYANFCGVSHTPFDFTLTFCEVQPLSERDVQAAQDEHVIRAPVRARVVVPVQIVASLAAALQEQLRAYNDAQAAGGHLKGPVH